MRQPLQQYRRRIPHEYGQLKLRRLGIIKYANGNLRYKPVKLFRHDHCGHPGSAPRGAEIRDEVHKQHRQQQRRKRGDGDHRLLFLLSEYEVFGSTTYANSNEASKQAQYSYYSAGNSKVKYNHSATSTAVYWWLRSPLASNSARFVIVGTDGTVNYRYADYSRGFAPGFCV